MLTRRFVLNAAIGWNPRPRVSPKQPDAPTSYEPQAQSERSPVEAHAIPTRDRSFPCPERLPASFRRTPESRVRRAGFTPPLNRAATVRERFSTTDETASSRGRSSVTNVICAKHDTRGSRRTTVSGAGRTRQWGMNFETLFPVWDQHGRSFKHVQREQPRSTTIHDLRRSCSVRRADPGFQADSKQYEL